MLSDHAPSTGDPMREPDPARETPRWPERLRDLARSLREGRAGIHGDRILEETWQILNSSLDLFLRQHARRLGRFSAEDFEDIAAQKSLDLLRKCEEGLWDPEGRTAAEIAGFLSTVARNGLVDLRRRRERLVDPGGEDGDRASWEERVTALDARDPAAGTPDAGIESAQFARALRDCAQRLQPRSRRIWFFRVFYDMSSKRIAAHPEVELNPGHVDVLLQRCRETLRRCMERAGYTPREIPPGSFVALWEAFRPDEDRKGAP
jgi:RNA polymerase sigma factor (sigma-70 family)